MNFLDKKRLFFLTAYSVTAICVFWLGWVLFYAFQLNWLFAALLLIPVAFILKDAHSIFDRSKTRLTDIKRGASCEQRVFNYLSQSLPLDSYSIFSDVKISRSGNIDFVVIGPTGVFAIEVKSREGTISSRHDLTFQPEGRKKKNFVKQTLNEAWDLHNYLSLHTHHDTWVTPVLVFASPKAFVLFDEHIKHDHVYIVSLEQLTRVILNSRQQLNPLRISVIEEALDRSKRLRFPLNTQMERDSHGRPADGAPSE